MEQRNLARIGEQLGLEVLNSLGWANLIDDPGMEPRPKKEPNISCCNFSFKLAEATFLEEVKLVVPF